MTLLLNVCLILLIGMSIGVILLGQMRKAVILSGMLSCVASLLFAFLAAPDMALAEAVIGCTLSTIVMLFGIRHIRLVHVFYVRADSGAVGRRHLKRIEQHFSALEIDIHVVEIDRTPREILQRYRQEVDFIIEEHGQDITLHYKNDDALYEKVRHALEAATKKTVQAKRLSEIEEAVAYEA